MQENNTNFANQTINTKSKNYSKLIKKIIKLVRSYHLNYNESKYIFKEVRTKLNLKPQQKPNRIIRSLSKDKIQTFINTAYQLDSKKGLMIKTIYLTGTRNNEFVNIKVEDFDYSGRKILIKEAKGGQWKMREVPLLSSHADELKIYIDGLNRNRGYLFESNRNTRYSTRRIQQIVSEVAAIARLDVNEIYPHKLRHSIAQFLYDNGMPKELVQKFLGHTNIKSTEIYAQTSIQHIRQPFNKIMLGYDGIN